MAKYILEKETSDHNICEPKDPKYSPDPKWDHDRENAARLTTIEKKDLLYLLKGKELDPKVREKLLEQTNLKTEPEVTYPTGIWEVYYITLTGSHGTFYGIPGENIHEACFRAQVRLSYSSDFWPEDFMVRGAKLVEFRKENLSPPNDLPTIHIPAPADS